MNVTIIVCTVVGALVGIGTLYYVARGNSLTAREKAIADAKEPLEREIQELRNENAELRRDIRDLRRRCEHLEDELRRRT